MLKSVTNIACLVTLAVTIPQATVFAQNLPGSADAGRIEVEPEKILSTPELQQNILPSPNVEETQAPEGAENIRFILNNLTIEGIEALEPETVEKIYTSYLGKEIPLSMIWDFAEEITAAYQKEGYFLSRAYVPAQEIDNGNVVIKTIEGYIKDVKIEGKNPDNILTNNIKNRISLQKPIKLKSLENALLLLNDIPGLSFEAVLTRLTDNSPEGAVQLTLKQVTTKSRASVFLNNHGSRYTGPHRGSFAYQNSFLPQHETTIAGVASIPGGNELWGVNASHQYFIHPQAKISAVFGKTVSHPGYTLSLNDIESNSLNWGIGIDWKVLRQRRYNLDLRLSLEGRNVNTDILDTPFTRDRIRVLRARASSNTIDPLDGYNTLSATLSRGITGLGASEPGEVNLSRANAKPDFTKLEATWQRSQYITHDWVSVLTVTGQRSSKPLYSSEEFGLGGPFLGRGYDSSEITGDHGIGTSFEMRYTDITPIKKTTFTPYAFYDFGKIWNIDLGQDDGVSIASLGAGLSIAHPSGFVGELTIAAPLTKSIDTPTYGNNGHNPRIYFQTGWQF